MNYLKRQYSLWHFVSRLKQIYDDPNLANNYISRNQLYKKIVRGFFSRKNPLEDKENKLIFNWGTKEFKDSLKNGHNLESMENNLEFLKKEFDNFFEELLEKEVIKADDDPYSPQYFLNRTSPIVYWELGILNFTKIIWQLISILKGK